MLSFYQTTIGKKFVVAGTGLILFGFVVGHLAGNLQVFSGADKINDYAAFLRANPPILWGTRVVLLVAVFLHILCTAQLARLNRAGRPVGYAVKKNEHSPFPSRIMIVSGLILLAYLVYHLLHLTLGWVHPNFNVDDVYGNIVTGLRVPWVAGFYIVGMLALGLHLAHGVWSVFQTLGLNHPKYNPWRRRLAMGAAVAIALGYIVIPVAVLFGFLQ